VSEILSAVQKEGIAAVRRYSERLDGWNPESFVVSEEEIRRAEGSVDDELKDHIRFAQEQVENFASLQKETLVDFERETLPGVVLGQKQIPVNAVGSYTPSGMYPMFGSSIMTVAVAKVAGVKRVVAIAAPRKGKTASPTASTSRCSTRWPAAGPTRYCASAGCRPWPQCRSAWRRWSRST
jgi:sulfopropanediol 3-dehydrogenase